MEQLPTAKEVLDTIKVITDSFKPEKGSVMLEVIDGHYLMITPNCIQELTYTEYQDYKQMLERNNN